MKITKVEAIELRMPEDQIKCIPSGTQDTLIVKIHTDEGITGIGEVESSPRIAKAVIEAPMSNCFITGMGRLLIGENPLNVEPINHKLFNSSLFCGRGAIMTHTIGGIDIALWDIMGKYYGQPIYQLLGGAFHDKLRVYASIKFADTAAETRALGRECIAKGFNAIKFGYGRIGESETLDLELIEAAYEGVEGNDFMLDIGTRWDVKTAKRRVRQIEHLNPLWIEEPIAADNLEGYSELSKYSAIPIAAGEAETGINDYRNLIERGGIDILQLDLARNGFTVAKKVADMAEMRGQKLCNHCFTTPINLTAGLHWLMSRKNAYAAEYSLEDTVFRTQLVKNMPIAKNGYITLTDAPGLGIELNEDIVEQYRI
jgi:L-rhamnonate dehydratase